jgi:hypothetical protein
MQWYGSPPLTESDVAELVGEVNCSYGVAWFGGDLWAPGPPPRFFRPGSGMRLPAEPLRVQREVGDGTWVSGSVTTSSDPDVSPRPDNWWAVLVAADEDLGLLLIGDFTYDDFEDTGRREGVIFELPEGPMLDLQVLSADLACQYADLLGGVPIAGCTDGLSELAADGSTLRAWAWTPHPGAP